MPEFVPCDPITPDVVQFSEEPTAQFVLFTNARIFDGKSERLTEPQEVLVHKHLIRKVGPLVPVPQDVKLVKIDCGGRTLLPGLIDMHSQVCLQEGFFEVKKYDTMTMGALAAHDLQDYLQQGFTSCRDAGGNTLGLAKAIQERRLAGPRLFSSGAYLTQTAGHGDPAPPFSYGKQEERLHGDGFVSVCDGIHEVLKAARRNLRSKATQLTLITGGSTNDALHGTQFTLEEMKAAVSVASDFGTYAMAVSSVFCAFHLLNRKLSMHIMIDLSTVLLTPV